MKRESWLRSTDRSRVSRRTVLKGASMAVGAMLLGSAAACGESSNERAPGQSPSATTRIQQQKPQKGGVLKYALASQMRGLNPRIGGDAPNTGGNVYDHLLYYTPYTNTTEVGMAKSVENPDPLTYIFKIRPEAKFQNLPPVNGRPVTSEDVKISWQAFVDDPRAANKAFFVDYIDRVETPDAATAVVKMKNANAWVMTYNGLAGTNTFIVPKEIAAPDLLDTKAIGSGGFVLDKFVATAGLTYVRRPDGWYVSDRPYIDRLEGTVLADDPVRDAAFKSKQIDGRGARDKVHAQELQGISSDVVIERELGSAFWLMLRADPEGGLFQDIRVRQALYCALDLKKFIDSVELGEGEWSGPISPAAVYYALPPDEVKKIFPHDLQKAKELLSAANWDNNMEIDFKYPSTDKHHLFAGELQPQLRAVGIRIKLVPQDYSTIWYPTTNLQKDFQMTMNAPLNSLMPETYLRQQTTQGVGNGNLCRWSNKEYDALYVKQQTEFDKEKQKQLILEAQRLLVKNFAPIVQTFAPYGLSARWAYYHPAPRELGTIGAYGHQAWIDVNHPAYPRDRQ